MEVLMLKGFVVLLMSVLVGGYIEVVEERGCHDAQFRLTCRHLDARIAVLEATYSTTNSTVVDFNCLLPTTPTSDVISSSTGSDQLSYENAPGSNTSHLRLPRSIPTPEEAHIRLPVNHRCSGLNHCSFILTSDYKTAEDWGPGVVYIRYACMDMEHIIRKCQEEILVEDEGFVQSPGYPQYNVGDSECHWRLRARPGQRVQLTLLDISLRGIGSMDTECKDKLQVKEGSRTLLSTCGEREEAIVLESEGSGLNVSVSIASRKLFPKRGVFFHYKALGCPPLPPPKDGYLVNHNETDAQYMCCVGFVFPDTFHRVKNLHCENGNRWHTSLPDCINVTFNKWQKNATLGGYPYSEMNITLYEVAAMRKESDFMYDILLPTMIISVLMIGNGVIIFVIFYLRKRRKLQQQADDEELGAIFQPHDGSVSDKAISV